MGAKSGEAPDAHSKRLVVSRLRGGEREETYESTNLSRLTQLGFLGLNFMNLLNRTCETGAMPMGAPGWPELALAVASTYRMNRQLQEAIGGQPRRCSWRWMWAEEC